MKLLIWILGIAAAILLGIWGWKKLLAYMNSDNARDPAERAANIQSDASDKQVGAFYPTLTPMASWVRMNGALIDLNTIGGSIPPLYTLPSMPSSMPNG